MSDNFSTDKEWNAAEYRARVLADLPEQLTQDDVERAMRQLDVSRATLFRWLKKFRNDGRTSALLPSPRGPKPGMQPLDPDVEAIVSRLFGELYATRRKPTKTRFWREVAADCRDQGLAPPSIRRLYGLGQGSLLQTFALTIGISRIAEDPVTRAIEVLLASDADGQERLRDVLKAWPLSLRRRISARLWRAERDEREREIAEKATRRLQSHKLRYVQSHQYRYRIS